MTDARVWDYRTTAPISDETEDVTRSLQRMALAIRELQGQAVRGLPKGYYFQVEDGELFIYDEVQKRRAPLSSANWETINV